MELRVATDILRELGPLGSRLKRLAERMQAGAAHHHRCRPAAAAGADAAARGARPRLTVGQLVEAVGSSRPGVTRAAGQLSRSVGALRTRCRPAPATLSLTPPAKPRWRGSGCWSAASASVTEMLGACRPCSEQIAGIGGLGRAAARRVAAVERSGLSSSIFATTSPPPSTTSTPNGSRPCSGWSRSRGAENPKARILGAGGAILFVRARASA
jgi:hypothetical protein